MLTVEVVAVVVVKMLATVALLLVDLLGISGIRAVHEPPTKASIFFPLWTIYISPIAIAHKRSVYKL